MKKSIYFCISFIIFLTACSSINDENNFYLNRNGDEIEVTYFLKNDIAIGQETKSKILYKNLNVKNDEDAKKLLAPFYEPYKQLSGLEHEVEYKEHYLIEKNKIKYSELDKNTLTELNLFFGKNDKEQSISDIKKVMKELGFSEEKNSVSNIKNKQLDDEMNLYNELVKDFNTTSIEELKNIKTKYLLYVGYQECPYCRIFVPKLHMSITEKNQNVYYLDTNTLKDSKEEKEFIEKLNLETVPALYIIENNKVKELEFVSSENLEIKEINTFLSDNFNYTNLP